MDLRFEGMHAVVCGSTQGIGKAVAKLLSDLGASLTLVSRDAQKLESTIREFQNPDKHRYLVADFSRPDELEQHRQSLRERDVHILINNTGGPPPGPAAEASVSAYLDAFKAHLICNQILVQETIPGMKKNGFGRIINIISTSVKQPIPGLGVSNTIRGAVANWSKTLSMELGPHGITVNNVLPGYTMTNRLRQLITRRAEEARISQEEIQRDMQDEVPLRRIASPEEVANAVVFIASRAAGYINGINLPVDGGRTGSL